MGWAFDSASLLRGRREAKIVANGIVADFGRAVGYFLSRDELLGELRNAGAGWREVRFLVSTGMKFGLILEPVPSGVDFRLFIWARHAAPGRAIICPYAKVDVCVETAEGEWICGNTSLAVIPDVPRSLASLSEISEEEFAGILGRLFAGRGMRETFRRALSATAKRARRRLGSEGGEGWERRFLARCLRGYAEVNDWFQHVEEDAVLGGMNLVGLHLVVFSDGLRFVEHGELF